MVPFVNLSIVATSRNITGTVQRVAPTGNLLGVRSLTCGWLIAYIFAAY